jgi:hypothetical protein
MVDIDPLKLQAAALDDIASAIGRETVILPVLNGMGHFAILTCMDAFEAACKDLDGAGQHAFAPPRRSNWSRSSGLRPADLGFPAVSNTIGIAAVAAFAATDEGLPPHSAEKMA